jgi:hypothetical protein
MIGRTLKSFERDSRASIKDTSFDDRVIVTKHQARESDIELVRGERSRVSTQSFLARSSVSSQVQPRDSVSFQMKFDDEIPAFDDQEGGVSQTLFPQDDNIFHDVDQNFIPRMDDEYLGIGETKGTDDQPMNVVEADAMDIANIELEETRVLASPPPIPTADAETEVKAKPVSRPKAKRQKVVVS